MRTSAANRELALSLTKATTAYLLPNFQPIPELVP
jgi:hypothetical protein